MFEGCEEFLDQVRRKGDKLDKRMMYERKQQIREKHLKAPPQWILGTIKTELKLFEHDETLNDLHDKHNKALAYWRQNHRQYPPERVWDKYYFDLLRKSFNLWVWCEAREKQLRDPMYLEEQLRLQMKAEEEKRLAREVE
jgi:hypothetical protein